MSGQRPLSEVEIQTSNPQKLGLLRVEPGPAQKRSAVCACSIERSPAFLELAAKGRARVISDAEMQQLDWAGLR